MFTAVEYKIYPQLRVWIPVKHKIYPQLSHCPSFPTRGLWFSVCNAVISIITYRSNRNNVSIPNPPLYRLKKNGLGVTSLSKSVLSLFDLVLWEQFFPVYWSLQGRYFFECGSQPCVRIHTGLQAASQQRIKYAVVLCTAVIA